MRDELLKKIEMLFIKHDVDVGDISSELFMILNDYEITKRCTEIATTEQRDIDFYTKKFLLAKKIKGCSEQTIKKYHATLCLFFMEIQKKPTEVTTDDIRLFIALKETRDKCSKVGIKSYVRDISSFFSWMHDEEYIAKNPMKKIEPIKCPKIKKEAFSELEIEKMRYACENARETMVLEVLLSTGCRAEEFSKIRLSDIDQKFEKILIHGKGAKDRMVYLNAKSVIAMQIYLKERKDNNPYLNPGSVNQRGNMGLLKKSKRNKLKDWYKYEDLVDPILPVKKETINGVVKRIGKRAGVDKVHAHKFRRTCATRALKAGMPIEQVSKMLGHESIDTTQIYLDLSEDDLAIAHKKYVR